MGTVSVVLVVVALIYKFVAKDPNFDAFADLYDDKSSALEWVFKIGAGLSILSLKASLISIPDVSDTYLYVQQFGYALCAASFVLALYIAFLNNAAEQDAAAIAQAWKFFFTNAVLQIGVIVSPPQLSVIGSL